ncbi:MAG: type II toxin-antitoxin system prevent-host-death family antitoxin [Truepera sp.]|nr:type II toxin-antitoxin system prevent-host-death family antitoxin [Truepera sp.]
MQTFHLHEAKARLSKLIEAVQSGEEIVISRYGKPVAKLVGLGGLGTRELGFYPIAFTSDLLDPTSEEAASASPKHGLRRAPDGLAEVTVGLPQRHPVERKR